MAKGFREAPQHFVIITTIEAPSEQVSSRDGVHGEVVARKTYTLSMISEAIVAVHPIYGGEIGGHNEEK